MKEISNVLKKAGTAAILALGIGVFAGAGSAYAAEGIDMSTDYPGITAKAGDSVSFALDFESLTGEGYDVDLETALVSFGVTIPENAETGTYTIELGADAGGDYTDTLSLQVTINEQENGQGSFSTSASSQEGSTGTSFSFDTTITNNHGSEQTYSLAATAPDGWQVSFTTDDTSQVASITVDAWSSQSVTIDITPPENVEVGEYSIPVTAVSTSETLDLELTVNITGTYDVTLSTPTGNLSLDAYANAEQSLTLQITNNGNVDLTNLSLSSETPSNWEVTFEDSEIETLEAGQSVEVTAYITPDENAMTGDYVTTLTVSNDEVSSDAEFRVSVKTCTVWGVIAVVIIIALIGGLGFIIKKYGRR